MSLFQSILLILTSGIILFTALGAVYQMFFGLIYVFCCKKRNFHQTPIHFFTILIPAHNESDGLKPVLERCLNLDYPHELYRIVVVADNCTDKTAQVVRNSGVECLERFDERKRGKGEALAWSIPQILAGKTDAIMILDADSYLEPLTLQVCDGELQKGNHVVQISYLAADPDNSFRCYALALARFIENQLYHWAKSKVGLAAFLTGSGMVFHREILEKYPWQSNGLTEDFEYCLDLIKHGVTPVFAGDVALESPFSAETTQLTVQRTRWISGGLDALRHSAFPLIWKGIREWNLIALDTGISMFFISRPLVIGQVLLSGLLAVGCLRFAPSMGANLLTAIWGGIVFVYFSYVLLGIFAMRLTKRRMKFLCLLPIFVLRYFGIAVKSVLQRPKKWERTPRSPIK
ncbi:MAG: glycosyltransferase family 2 protein [Planctomycetaceae bacterium]|jgi:cellulose synthase/poly-beta-1,6-N-acetylglucosamine synthase-like glycosyltransferase|nr:glycosyltransferase family 2 protein [Planctomycetaceae bacterium]